MTTDGTEKGDQVPTEKDGTPRVMWLEQRLSLHKQALQRENELLYHNFKTLAEHVKALDAARLADRTAELENAFVKLSDMFSTLAERVKVKYPDAGVWDWTNMNRDQAGNCWYQLIKWRQDVLARRYPTEYAKMSTPCWYRHPDVVEDLSALYRSWVHIYTDPDTAPLQAVYWIGQHLPAAAARQQRIMADCFQGGQHAHQPAPQAATHDDAEISAFINADLERRPLPDNG